MDLSLDQLFSYQPITGITINTVLLAPDFRTLLYILLFVVLAGVAAVQLLRSRPFRRAFASAVLAAFFTVSIAAAIQADIGWNSWLSVDRYKFGGRTTEEKLAVLEGPLYEVIRNIRRVVPGDYMLFTSDAYLLQRTEYFLLPHRKRDRADSIIVLEDRQARFDPVKHVFSRGDVTIDHLTPVYTYGPGVYVLRKQ